MRTIYRYEMEVSDRIVLTMPARARILSVLPSDRLPYGISLWAIVDTALVPEPRQLIVHGTGHPLTEGLGRFVGTVSHGSLVWHVFEPAPVVGDRMTLELAASADGDPPE